MSPSRRLPRLPAPPLRQQLREAWSVVLPAAPVAVRTLSTSGSARLAYLQVLGLVAVFFGPGVLNTVLFLAGQLPAPTAALSPGLALSAAGRDLAGTAAAIWLVAMLAQRRCLRGPQLGWGSPLPRRAGVRQALAVGFGYTCALIVSNLLVEPMRRWFGGNSYPHPPEGPWGVVQAVTSSLRAGIVEELVLVAALVTILEHARQPWPRIMAVGLTVRLSFHIFYGDPSTGLVAALWVLPWAAAALLLFRRSRRLTPLVVAHAAYDLVISLQASLSDTGDDVVRAASAGVVLLAATLYLLLTPPSAGRLQLARPELAGRPQRLVDAADPAARGRRRR